MKYFSTRNSMYGVTAAEAIAKGLAPDGGLFVPETVPQLDMDEIAALCNMDYCGRAVYIMSKYLDDFSEDELKALCASAYGSGFDCDAVAPLRVLNGTTAVLELWHGPTCAFKGMALQLLPHLLTASLKKCGEARRVCILVATSGDTGKAALEGFADVPGTKIQVFYPNDGVSEAQKLQMITQTGKNVGVTAVVGNFDDAQSGVKRIFSDTDFAAKLTERGYFLSSANSINWGRLLPQIVYYFSAYCDFVKSGGIALGDTVDFSVPTGNFGNILAGWYARSMGLPVGRLLCASNANNVLSDFLASGCYDRNRAFHNTLSPSMDILVSSNLERLLCNLSGSTEETAGYMKQLSDSGRYTVSPKLKAAIDECFVGGYCSDAETLETIKTVWDKDSYLMDTHTAVAYKVLCDIRSGEGVERPCIVVSTASPFKFSDSVLKALGDNAEKSGAELIERLSEVSGIEVPLPLRGLTEREVRFKDIIPPSGMKTAVDEFLK